MKKYFLPIVVLSLIKLSIHFAGNANYGFQRDELLHLAVSEQLQWGYMEFPPFIAAVGKISHMLFDYTVFGTRVFPTVAGVCILVLTCLIALEFGGGKKSVWLAGVTYLAFLPFYRNHTLFQPVAFEQLFWLMALYFFVRYINTRKYEYLLLMGFTAGLGLLNKYTFLIWGLSFVVAIMFFERGRLFRERWLYIAGIIAGVVVLPNVLWQASHHFPILLHHEKLQEVQLSQLKWWEFPAFQLKFPFTLLMTFTGLYALLRVEMLARWRSLGVFFIVTFFVMWITGSKGYYFFVAYPVMFAAAAVAIEGYVEKRKWLYYSVIVVLAITTIPFIPDLAPVLPIETYVKYKKKEPDANGRYELTSDYADMFGWEEQVALVDSLYQSLDAEDKERCIIWTENYGEAGAVKIIGGRYSLPDPICAHGSFWLLGPGTKKGDVCISLGNEKESVERVFWDYVLIKMIRHPYAIDEENNIPLYLCRNPKIDIQAKWPELEKYVFD